MKNAILSGFIIGLAALLSCSIDNTYLAALFFSLGLLYMRIEELPLFTGQNQKLPTKEITFWQLLKILYYNVIGVGFTLILTFGLAFHHNILVDNYTAVIATKWIFPWWYYIFSGFICGFLMTIAMRPNTPLWVSSLCVAAFILGKFNHCVADWFFYAPSHILLWFCVVLGNLIGGIAAVPNKNKI